MVAGIPTVFGRMRAQILDILEHVVHKHTCLFRQKADETGSAVMPTQQWHNAFAHFAHLANVQHTFSSCRIWEEQGAHVVANVVSTRNCHMLPI